MVACVHAWAHARVCVCEVQGKLSRVGSLLLCVSRESRVLTLGHQACWQVPLPTEPPHLPEFGIIKTCLTSWFTIWFRESPMGCREGCVICTVLGGMFWRGWRFKSPSYDIDLSCHNKDGTGRKKDIKGSSGAGAGVAGLGWSSYDGLHGNGLTHIWPAAWKLKWGQLIRCLVDIWAKKERFKRMLCDRAGQCWGSFILCSGWGHLKFN